MDSILWLARIIGPVFLVLSTWIFCRPDSAQNMWNSTKHTPSSFFLGAVLNLFVGFTILSTYHVWTFGYPILLTLVGYLLILRAILVLFAPLTVIKITDYAMAYARIVSLIPFAVGALLTYFAFIR